MLRYIYGLWAGHAIDLADVRLRIGEQRGDHASASPVLSLRVRDRHLLVRRIDDDHGEQPRRLGVTGVVAHPMMGAGALEPRLTGPVDAGGPVIDLAPDLAREDVGVDESGAGVMVRGRAPPRRVVDDVADKALPRQVRDRLVRGDGDGFAGRAPWMLPAAGAGAGSSKSAKAAAATDDTVSSILLKRMAISCAHSFGRRRSTITARRNGVSSAFKKPSRRHTLRRGTTTSS